MRKRNVFAIAAAALVAGLVLGSFGLASAAPSQTATGTPGAGAGLGRMMRQSGATLADIVAKLTGRGVDEVRADRQAGKSFADIAKAKGVSSDKIVGATLDARKAALDAAVKDGRITQAQADTMLANMKARLTDRVDDAAAGCTGAGGGFGRGRGGAGGGGCGGGCL
jgi:hypothetical protein